MSEAKDIFTGIIGALKDRPLTTVLTIDGNLYFGFDDLVLYLLFDAAETTEDSYTVTVQVHLGEPSQPLSAETRGNFEITDVVDGFEFPPFSGKTTTFYNQDSKEQFGLKLDLTKLDPPKLMGKTLTGIHPFANGIKLEFAEDLFIFLVPVSNEGLCEIYSGQGTEIKSKDGFPLTTREP